MSGELEPADEVETLGTCKYHFGVGPLSGTGVPLHPQSPSCVEWTPFRTDGGSEGDGDEEQIKRMDAEPIADEELDNLRRSSSPVLIAFRPFIARIDAEVAKRQEVEGERDRLLEALNLWRDNVGPRDSFGKCWWCGSNRVSSGADGVDGHYEPCSSHTALAPTEAPS
jgi:hypothetical protein